jgi:hypothetical protein
MRRRETYADYGHQLARQAISDFRSRVNGGTDGFDEELRAFVHRLYHRAADTEASYFLDKTPRYHLLAPDLMDLFPNAKIIILWRNPLAIIASMIETWGEGRWNVYRYRVDLYQGLPNLVDLARQTNESVDAVRFEDLVTDTDNPWERLGDHLGIDVGDLERTPPVLEGKMGDPNQRQYEEVSSSPVDKWKTTLRNPLRKAWVRRYLQWLGEERLDVMGYSLDDLQAELEALPLSADRIGGDLMGMGLGLLQPVIEHYILKDKLNKSRWTQVVSHF